MTGPDPDRGRPRSPQEPPPGFLDAASGEPLHPAARDVLASLLGLVPGAPAGAAADPASWADPDRRYGSARRAAILLQQARERVAAHLGCRPAEVSFTGSGTQAVHLGVAGGLLGRRRAGDVLVCSAVEHSAVLAAGDRHTVDGGSTHVVGVDRDGCVDLDA